MPEAAPLSFVRALARRVPMTFRWFRGRTTPPVSPEEIVYFEDETEDNAKILMRRSNRIFVFHSAELGEPAPTTYTDEDAQDAVGAILTDTPSIDLTYNDAAGTITAKRAALTGDVTASADSNTTTIANAVLAALIAANFKVFFQSSAPAVPTTSGAFWWDTSTNPTVIKTNLADSLGNWHWEAWHAGRTI